MRRLIGTFTTCLFALALVAGIAPGRAEAAKGFPSTISLPNGWLPEGIVTGRGPVIYAGSRATGAIYAANLRTGEGEIVVPAQQDRVAVGLDFDRRTNYIFVAGGNTGSAYVYDARTGESVGAYTLVSGRQSFINDVTVTREAAYFTDSASSVIFRLPLGPGGRLPAPDAVETIALGGEYEQVAGFNANGIEATPDGKRLIVVNSSTGLLYQVDPETGTATTIDLGGDAVTNGDGILLQGSELYVVRNRLNEIAVIELAPDLGSGEVVETITSPKLDVPTTIARFGSRLYVVNARFTTPPTPSTEYDIVKVER